MIWAGFISLYVFLHLTLFCLFILHTYHFYINAALVFLMTAHGTVSLLEEHWINLNKFSKYSPSSFTVKKHCSTFSDIGKDFNYSPHSPLPSHIMDFYLSNPGSNGRRTPSITKFPRVSHLGFKTTLGLGLALTESRLFSRRLSDGFLSAFSHQPKTADFHGKREKGELWRNYIIWL